ncbi:Flagellin [Moorella glycerini]|uniref:Flagellin n=1 Tax=Neomoorella stamsii TaxID=1266720 RepID=A0A9X7J279_9FIRM|nr:MULTISPECIES: flagellin [Moorella]PRR72307.1 A-type flagellin [Moorella stamsii]CEP68882.1 Flagellin [Moorella glycerini]
MRINQNIAALNAYRNLTVTNSALTKSMEKLSSGLRINRAADDAAGLAISEKMRGQIRGLNQAVRNAQDSISLLQTAEGALNETHAILQRMRELAVQASNDTNTNSDRFEIQKEINQLAEELTRIGNTTEFNTKKLLNGEFSSVFHIGANQGQTIALNINDMRASALAVTAASAVYTADKGETNYNQAKDANVQNLKAGTYRAEVAGDGKVILYNEQGTALGSGTLADNASSVTIGGLSAYMVTGSSITLGISDTNPATGVTTDAGTITIHVLEKGQGISVMTQADAEKAITAVQAALDRVSSQRSNLGAMQNRLEHTIANLSVASENLTAAESRIRDLDMAQEMMAFTKNQILTQAGTAMLAQANQQPATVLELLR